APAWRRGRSAQDRSDPARRAAVSHTLPPERFYWAVLDEPCPRRLTARHRARLGYSFESVLPAPIEAVHATYLSAGDRTIACAIDRDNLEQVRADGALSLHPAAAPDFISDKVEPP